MFQKEILKLNELKNKSLNFDSPDSLIKSKSLSALYEVKADQNIIDQAEKTAELLYDKFDDFIVALQAGEPNVPTNTIEYLKTLNDEFRKTIDSLIQDEFNNKKEIKYKINLLVAQATLCAKSFNAISLAITKTLELISKTPQMRDYIKSDDNLIKMSIFQLFHRMKHQNKIGQNLENSFFDSIKKLYVAPEIKIEQMPTWKTFFKKKIGSYIKDPRLNIEDSIKYVNDYDDEKFCNDITDLSIESLLEIKKATEKISSITAEKIKSRFLKDAEINSSSNTGTVGEGNQRNQGNLIGKSNCIKSSSSNLFENKKISLKSLENINIGKTQLSNFENWAKIAGIK